MFEKLILNHYNHFSPILYGGGDGGDGDGGDDANTGAYGGYGFSDEDTGFGETGFSLGGSEDTSPSDDTGGQYSGPGPGELGAHEGGYAGASDPTGTPEGTNPGNPYGDGGDYTSGLDNSVTSPVGQAILDYTSLGKPVKGVLALPELGRDMREWAEENDFSFDPEAGDVSGDYGGNDPGPAPTETGEDEPTTTTPETEPETEQPTTTPAPEPSGTGGGEGGRTFVPQLVTVSPTEDDEEDLSYVSASVNPYYETRMHTLVTR